MRLSVLLLFLSLHSFAQDYEFVIGELAQDGITLSYLDASLSRTKTEEINLSEFDGWLTSSKYQSKSAYSPIYFSDNERSLFLSLNRIDELQGIQEWTRFLKYDLDSKLFEELATIENTSISFWHLLSDTRIIGVSGSALLDINLPDGTYDTLYDDGYYHEPVQLLVSDSTVDFIVESQKKLSVLSFHLTSSSVDRRHIASTLHYSSIYENKLLTIEGHGMNTIKLRESRNFDLAVTQKKLDLKNFSSYWYDEMVYLMTRDGILKSDETLETIDKFKCENPHINEIIGNWIFYSTKKSNQSIFESKHFAVSTDFNRIIELPFLNNRKSIIYINSRP